MPRSGFIRFLAAFALACVENAIANNASKTNSTLPAALSQIWSHQKRTPFKQVIEATTGHLVIDFDTNNPAHVELRAKILQAATLAGKRSAERGLVAERANEAGNRIQTQVRDALREAGLVARIPVNEVGNAQATGYPDLEITGPTPCYLELKTYSSTTANTTQRSFYYSPSEHPKITRDALHLLLAYQLEKSSRDGKTVFAPVHWKLITLQDLQVELKLEFNQSNRGLYGEDAAADLLSEGEVK